AQLKVLEVDAGGELALADAVAAPGIGSYYHYGFTPFQLTFTAWSEVAATPDGAYALVAAPGVNALHVFDTATRTVVRTLTLSGQPFSLAVTDRGTAVVAPMSGTQCAVIDLDGASASVVGTPSCPSRVLNVAYDAGSGRALVAGFSTSTAYWVDAEAGTSAPFSLPNSFGTLSAAVRPDGTPILMGWALDG